MKAKLVLVVVGAAGRMGRRIVALAVESGEFGIAGAVEMKGHPDIGKDAGIIAGAGAINVELADVLSAGGDVVIDFSLPESVDKKSPILFLHRDFCPARSRQESLRYLLNHI